MKNSFYSLSPDAVLNAVETALAKHYPGCRTTGKAFALNSLENRVFEIELEDKIVGTNENSVVVKFYRPGRWTKEQIAEEHSFIRELKAAEVPAVAALTEIETTEDGIHFVVFPKIRGRLKDELQPEELRQLGRLVARMHSVGERFPVKQRRSLDIETFGIDSLEFLLDSNFLDPNIKNRYHDLCLEIFDASEDKLNQAKTYPIHGDCHVGNILWNEQGPFFLDFDDMIVAPPVQDIWMIIKGRDAADVDMRNHLLTGYNDMKDFDYATLALVEPLRALRMIHYSAWIGRRWQDPSFPNMFAHYGNIAYWNEEMEALSEVLQIIRYGYDASTEDR